MPCNVLNFCKITFSHLVYFRFPQIWSQMRRTLGDASVMGAEEILNQGGNNLTNADVVDAIKIIQQRTKRKSSYLEVFKFRCKCIIMGVIVVIIIIIYCYFCFY